jgi:HlyD family secretion protein
MTAYVTILVASIANALKIPNTALRFRPPLPPAQVANLLAQYGITGEGTATAASPAAGGDAAIVWKLRADKALEPIQVALGITDHAYTEVVNTVKGALNPDDEVVTASIEPIGSNAPGGPR